MSELSTTSGTADPGDAAADQSQPPTEQGAAQASQARQVQETAKDEASQVVRHVSQQTKGVVEDSKAHLRSQAQEQADRFAGLLHSLAEEARALVEGGADDAGELGNYARDATAQLQRLADRVGELGWDGMIDEVGRFARRRPGTFLVGAAAAGFAVARLGRGAKDGQPSSGSASVSPGVARSRESGSGALPTTTPRSLTTSPGGEHHQADAPEHRS